MPQYPRRFFAFNIQMIFQYNLILRQRTGLISAENVNRSKVLDRI